MEQKLPTHQKESEVQGDRDFIPSDRAVPQATT